MTATSVPPLQFPLPRNNVIEIRLKSKVTAKEFEKLKQLFSLLAFAFLEDGESDPDLSGIEAAGGVYVTDR